MRGLRGVYTLKRRPLDPESDSIAAGYSRSRTKESTNRFMASTIRSWDVLFIESVLICTNQWLINFLLISHPHKTR